MQAWAVFPNHYHFVAMGAEDLNTLRQFLRVWFNFWETHLTYERSYLSRLRYVHENPVHHGVARRAVDYRWCSARWFEASAEPAFQRTVATFKTDRLHLRDDFEVVAVD